jgi:hypothetical protein
MKKGFDLSPVCSDRKVVSLRDNKVKPTNKLLATVSDPGHNGIVNSIEFHTKASEFIRVQATSIRRPIGEALRDLQKGVNLGMPLSRPIPMVAPGVHELRVRSEGTRR